MIALVIAALTAFLAIWIVVPAPNRFLLPLSVGAPEVCIWLLAAGVLALLLALPDAGVRTAARLATVLAVVALVLAASPFVRFAAVAASAEQSMEAALGADYRRAHPGRASRALVARAALPAHAPPRFWRSP